MATSVEPQLGSQAPSPAFRAKQVQPAPPKGTERPQAKPTPVGSRYLVQVLLTSAPLAAADLLAVSLAMLLATTLGSLFYGGIDLITYWPALAVGMLVANTLFNLYPAIGQTPTFEFRQGTITTTLVFSLLVAVSLLRGGIASSQVTGLVIAGCLAVLLLPLARSLTRTICCRFRWWGHPVLLFGDSDDAGAVYDYLAMHRRQGLRPIGMIDGMRRQWQDEISETPTYLEPPAMAAELAREQGAFWGVIAMPKCSQVEIVEVMEKYAWWIPHLIVMQDTSELPCLWGRAHETVGLPGIRVKQRLLLPMPKHSKRAVDLAVTLLGGVLILPLIAVIGLAIRLTSRGPVFYSHQRIGRDQCRFQAWKFRTMVANADECLNQYLKANPHLLREWESDHKLKHDPRVTRIGNFLRKTSLDELPQIWNVLRGEMSLVGPRPIVADEIDKYADRYELYAKVLPGITGMWQISGRNNTSYPERVALDAYYVRNWSLWLDLYILARTIKVVLKREGAY